MGLDAPQVWDTERAYQHLQAIGEANTKRTAERRAARFHAERGNEEYEEYAICKSQFDISDPCRSS